MNVTSVKNKTGCIRDSGETAGQDNMNDGVSSKIDRVVTSSVVGNNAPGLH